MLAVVSLVLLSFALHQHGSMSRIAFSRAMEINADLDSIHAGIFANGSEREDKLLLVKLVNQHFHRPGWDPAGYRTFIRRFDKLKAELDRSLESVHNALSTNDRKALVEDLERTWLIAGQLAHYFQDVNCPPHVVPVYHTRSDGFDQFEFPAEAGFVVDQDMLAEWRLKEPKEVLDDIAVRTLATLDERFPALVDGRDTVLAWSSFWSPTPLEHARKHFGSYGQLGNNYGVELISRPRAPKQYPAAGTTFRWESVRVERQVYERHRQKQLNTAMTASVYLILWVQNRIAHMEVGR